MMLFLGKKNDIYTTKAVQFCRILFPSVECFLGDWGDPIPSRVTQWSGDYIVSFLSRWVIPEYVLKRTKIAAINFHPAPPEYPGIGCGNFALYEGATNYGVTCHHMKSKVDTGDIILTKEFSIFPNDNIETLLSRVYDYQLILFYDIMGMISSGKELPKSDKRWTRKPLTFKKLNELRLVHSGMSRDEIIKVCKATSYGPWKPLIELNGFVFELKGGINGNKVF